VRARIAAVVDLSVIIVTWNCREFAKECLRSIKETVHINFEIILVDNASSDGTVEEVRLAHPDVRVIANQHNLGFAKANNVGIAASCGNYLALINPDVVVLPNCIDAAVTVLDGDPSIGLLGPMMLDRNGNVQRSGMRLPTLWNVLCDALVLHTVFGRSPLFGGQLMRDFDWTTRRDIEVLNGWLWIVRRDTVSQVGQLDEGFFMYGEDVDWCRRIREHGWRVLFEPSTAAIHFGGGSSANAPVRFFLELQRANLRYWRKYFGLFSRSLYRAILVIHHLLRMVAYGALAVVNSSVDARHKSYCSAKCVLLLFVGSLRAEEAT
jgi:GT2 family glycosyltransferase